MTKQQIIELEQEENRALRRYIADLKYRHDKAINSLRDLARGLGRDWQGRQSGWGSCMQKLAADELAEIAKYPLREAP